MARPSIIASVRLRLEEYIKQTGTEYLGEPKAIRKPTLPYTGDFKVNIRALSKATGLKQTQAKYLYGVTVQAVRQRTVRTTAMRIGTQP